LRNQYKNYAQGFLDYQGPNSSGSPVAYALKAEDAHNATKGFLNMEPEEASRVKRILSGGGTADTQFVDGDIVTPGGKKEPAWRYRRDTSRLLDNFLDNDKKLNGLPKPKPVGEFVPPEPKPVAQRRVPEPKPVGEFVPPEKKPPSLQDVPEQEVMTPERLQKLKQDNLQNSSIVSHFGRYMALGGLVGGMFAFTGKDPIEKIKRGAEGVLVGSVSPYVIARLLEREDVVASLSKVTQKDLTRLMKLPPTQRSKVEDAIGQLAKEAEAKGKLKQPSPWLRVIGGKVAVNATKPSGINEDDQKALQQLQDEEDKESVPQ
jgi:hypothetical protein